MVCWLIFQPKTMANLLLANVQTAKCPSEPKTKLHDWWHSKCQIHFLLTQTQMMKIYQQWMSFTNHWPAACKESCLCRRTLPPKSRSCRYLLKNQATSVTFCQSFTVNWIQLRCIGDGFVLYVFLYTLSVLFSATDDSLKVCGHWPMAPSQLAST